MSKIKKIVVVGMGYVGIPVATKFAEKGFQVIGINRSKWKVDWINARRCPIRGREPGLKRLLAKVVRTGALKAIQSFKTCRDADAILVCTETPYDSEKQRPNYSALRAALVDISKNLSSGTLVVIESTLAPKTMQTFVRPLLESSRLKAGKDFLLAHCPERVRPGKLLYNLVNLDRVVGGINDRSTEQTIALYKNIVKGKLYPTDCLTAEVVKTVENTYRDVQIAFANEIALICEQLGIDVWEVRELVNKCPERAMHSPGAGVGGHCLPKDPLLLSSGISKTFEPKLIKLSRMINDWMPYHMFELTKNILQEAGRDLKGSKITVLGFAYVKESDDARNSPAIFLCKYLEKGGAEVIVHDPYVREYKGLNLSSELEKTLRCADCLVIVTAHRIYEKLNLRRLKKLLATPLIVDGRNVLDKRECERLGYRYKGIGNV